MGLFDRLKKQSSKIEFLYPDLSPKQRFLTILEKHVMPELQPLGFELLKTATAIRKKVDNFEWRVEFQASSWNRGNEVCKYDPYYLITNSQYKEFNKKHGITRNPLGVVGNTGGCQHWDGSGFSEDGKKVKFLEDYDFAKYDNLIMANDLVKNIIEVGIPYFKMMSNFDGIKKFYTYFDQVGEAPKLLSLALVLDRKKDISEIISWYDKKMKNPPEHIDREMTMLRQLVTE